MSALFAARERGRLAKVLALLPSDKPGEVLAAAAAASRMLREAGLTWGELLLPTPHDTDAPIGPNWRQTAAACSRYPRLLNRWEADYLAGLPRFQRLSAKQHSALVTIVVRLRACGCDL